MCLVKLLTSQFGGFPFRKLHCDAFDDAKTKPRTKAPPSPNRDRSQRKKKPFPELTGNLHSRGHSPCTTMRDAVCKVFFFLPLFFLLRSKKEKKMITGETRLFPLPVSYSGMMECRRGFEARRLRENVNQSHCGWRGGRFLKQTAPRSSRRGQVVF